MKFEALHNKSTSRVTAPSHDKWSDDWLDECAGGIHFFITRLEAEAY